MQNKDLGNGLNLRKRDDGYWLDFKTPSGSYASVNLENIVGSGGFIQRLILEWAVSMFPTGGK